MFGNQALMSEADLRFIILLGDFETNPGVVPLALVFYEAKVTV